MLVTDNIAGVHQGVRKFDAQSGRPMHGFSSKALDDPSGIGVDGNGFVYVLDRSHDLVYKLSNDLTYLNTFGGPGYGNGTFAGPIDIDADPGGPVGKWNGNLYVLDQPTGRIEVLGYPHGEEPAAPSGQ